MSPVRLTPPVTRTSHTVRTGHPVRPFVLLFPLLLLGAASCGGDGGGVIEDNLIRPGITAMNEASVLACNADKAALVMALETYEIMKGEITEGNPAVDQAALIEAGFLREPSTLHEVVDGQIRPVAPGCS